MRENATLLILPLIVALVLLGPYSNAQQRGSPDFSDKAEATRLRGMADALRLPVSKEGELRSEANLVGFQSKQVLFSGRTDSRTYFVQDLAREKETRFYRGSETEFKQRLNLVFHSLQVPPAEILQSKVMQEKTQEWRVDPQTGKMLMGEQRSGQRFLLATRQIDGVPVFSSRALLRLNEEGGISFLELHWPEIPAGTVLEAHRLQYKVREGWRPPAMEGAHVESVEAGIVHSPAVAFVMDIYPAIRVIYAPDAKDLGKKPLTAWANS